MLAACEPGGVIPGPGSVPLDEANATIRITQDDEDTEASVAATIKSGSGASLTLAGGQSVSVNGQGLTGASGQYSRIVTVAETYTITVNEPTRGVEDTEIALPGAFAITSHAAEATASLSGFTLSWSNTDANLTVKIDLTQTIVGSQKTQSFGPFQDTGTQTFDPDDLRDFGQGANLLITVTKINERRGINGFNTGTLTTELSTTVSVVPGA